MISMDEESVRAGQLVSSHRWSNRHSEKNCDDLIAWCRVTSRV